MYCNGSALLRNFDVYKEAGSENRAVDKVFHGLAPDEQSRLLVSFTRGNDYATLSALEVVDEGK